MSELKEIIYGQKINNIQGKFKHICWNYQQLEQQLQAKDKVITELNAKITFLQSSLQKNNIYVKQLQSQIQTKQDLNGISGLKYLNSKTFIPKMTKNQHFQKINLYQRQSKNKVESNVSINDQLNMNFHRFNHLSPPAYKSPALQSYRHENNFSKRLINIRQKIKAQSQDYTENFAKGFNDVTNLYQKSPNLLSAKSQKTFLNFQKELSQMKKQSQNILGKQNIKKPNKDMTTKAECHRDFFLEKNYARINTQNMQSQQDVQTLHKIRQQRDSEIFKMDELFQSISSRLKQYEHENVA